MSMLSPAEDPRTYPEFRTCRMSFTFSSSGGASSVEACPGTCWLAFIAASWFQTAVANKNMTQQRRRSMNGIRGIS
jgi:hypothetical protein